MRGGKFRTEKRRKLCLRVTSLLGLAGWPGGRVAPPSSLGPVWLLMVANYHGRHEREICQNSFLLYLFSLSLFFGPSLIGGRTSLSWYREMAFPIWDFACATHGEILFFFLYFSPWESLRWVALDTFIFSIKFLGPAAHFFALS
jgi:hypothetical protein